MDRNRIHFLLLYAMKHTRKSNDWRCSMAMSEIMTQSFYRLSQIQKVLLVGNTQRTLRNDQKTRIKVILFLNTDVEAKKISSIGIITYTVI